MAPSSGRAGDRLPGCNPWQGGVDPSHDFSFFFWNSEDSHLPLHPCTHPWLEAADFVDRPSPSDRDRLHFLGALSRRWGAKRDVFELNRRDGEE
jgi:hypothetical protein